MVPGGHGELDVKSDVVQEHLWSCGGEVAAACGHGIRDDVAAQRRDENLLSIRAPADDIPAVRGERPGLPPLRKGRHIGFVAAGFPRCEGDKLGVRREDAVIARLDERRKRAGCRRPDAQLVEVRILEKLDKKLAKQLSAASPQVNCGRFTACR